MRRFLILLLGAFLLAGCAQQSGDNNGGGRGPGAVDQLLYSEQADGATYEIRYKKDEADGITTEVVNYILTDTQTGRRVGLAVNKEGTSPSNSVYRLGIMAGRKTDPFPNSYWDRYTISLGQDNLYLDNAMSTPSEEGGEYRFLLVGGISRSDLQKLKEATLITVQLISSTNPERTISIPVVPNFQKALLAKMP